MTIQKIQKRLKAYEDEMEDIGCDDPLMLESVYIADVNTLLTALAEKESLAHDRGVIIDSQLEQIAALTAERDIACKDALEWQHRCMQVDMELSAAKARITSLTAELKMERTTHCWMSQTSTIFSKRADRRPASRSG
jgi:hypothetical protein